MDKNQLQVLKAFYEHADEDFCYRYSWIEDYTGLTRKAAEQAVRPLRLLGYIEYVNGLFDEEGKTAGSGFAMSYGRRENIKDLLTSEGIDFNDV